VFFNRTSVHWNYTELSWYCIRQFRLI
jgi:hypothetical protein